jgi:membrane-associated protease RseP (regulator of RpoE activity)
MWCGAAASAQEANPDAGYGELTDGAITVSQPLNTAEGAAYWLGIACRPMPPALRAQLNLSEKQGLLVEGVVPDSPAAKAGIVQHDVLLRAGDKSLAEPRDLVRAIEATKQAKLKIDLIHGGKPKTVEATPAKRPEEARRHAGAAPAPADWETMEKWLQDNWARTDEMFRGGKADGSRPPLRFRFVHPGMIVPPGVAAVPPLPAGVSVVISKEGDQPAKIVVRRGDQKWEVTEKELDKLPTDIRQHIERMLGRGTLGVVGALSSLDMPEVAPLKQPPQPDAGSAAPLPRRSDSFDRMEQRLDDMNRRMDKLFKEVEQLNGSRAQHQAPEKSVQP